MPPLNPNDPKLPFGSRKCRCNACGEYFNSETAFDGHRVGRYGVDRRCLSVDEMRQKGFSINVTRHWITRTFGAEDAFAKLADRIGAESRG